VNRRALLLGLTALATVIFAAFSGAALAAPEYDLKATWSNTNLPPGGQGEFDLWVRNIGNAAGKEEIKIEDELPAGVKAKVNGIHFYPLNSAVDQAEEFCFGSTTVTCEIPAASLPSFLPAPGLNAGSVASPTGYMGPLGIEVEIDPGASGTGINSAMVSGGSSAHPAIDIDQVPFSATPSPFGVAPGSFKADLFDAAFPFGDPSRQAGDHPFEMRVDFDLSQRTGTKLHSDKLKAFPNGALKTVETTLPRGMIGNPEGTPKCNPVLFAEKGSTENSTACPADTQIGYLNGETASGILFHQGASRVALYNLEPPKGQVADFGFDAGGLVIGHIYPTPDAAQDYAIEALVPNISDLVPITGTEATIWGVPGDPVHNKFRYYPTVQPGNIALGAPFGGTAIRPFLTNPFDCGFGNGGARIRMERYNEPGVFTQIEEYGNPDDVSGCEDPRFRFEPNIALQPTDRHAGAPTGLDVHLQLPQRNDEVDEAQKLYAENGDVKGISTPPIKRAVVTLPEGMTLSPSAAQGLGSCTAEEIGLGTDRPVRCPDDSQYGTLVLHTPILPLDAQPEGFIYVAKQSENPFHNFLSLYLVIQEPDRGILVKIPGKIDLNPHTGQITTTFDDLPQFPVSDMQMSFKGGVRAGLVEPSTCGTKTIRAEFFSWQDPSTSHLVNNSYEITQKPDGSPCVNALGERPFKPQLEAGMVNNRAGAYSPFGMRLTRSDDDQEFSQLRLNMPKGLTGKLAGIGECSDADISQAISRTGAGEGGLEELNPSCPASSLIGSTEVGAGVGVPLTYVPGRVYLAGPYKGAPLSVVVISPAVVGPFDLGLIVVRTAIRLDPETAEVSAVSDPFPQIFQGIPVRIRDIRLKLDRENFTLNPTGCAEKQIEAHVTGTGGNVDSNADDTAADLGNRFQAADCASLGFKPKLAFRLIGGTTRGAHPKLRATVTYPKYGSYSNVAAASVTLPHSEFLDQNHIGTVCTRVQFAAKQCPAASIYGHAVARSPLFDFSLEGPVYLRSSSHQLPDTVAVLRGPAAMPVEVDLDGHVDSVNGGIRNRFEVVPDAPVESFTLTLLGAKKGLLVNSTDLCVKPYRATAKFKAQNGKRITELPVLKASCSKARHRSRR
jgi:hypothetical protein